MTQDTPVRLEKLLQRIRSDFYSAVPLRKFLQDQNTLKLAATWPAVWLKQRGVTWTADRYFQVFEERLTEIKRFGATGEIKYFPGYLLKVVQDHFAHNSDVYCEEGKRGRMAFDIALGRVLSAAKIAENRSLEQGLDVLAEAHRLLVAKRRLPKAHCRDESQPELF